MMNEHKNDQSNEQQAQPLEDIQNSAEQPMDVDNQAADENTVKAAEDTAETELEGDLASELEAAQLEIAKLKDAYLRAKAEEDNVRRRTEKEMANSRKFAVEGFAREMLQVRDSLKLACDVQISDDAEDTIKSIHEGVNITLKQLDAAFSKFSLSEIAPQVGDKLDPNVHQAMSIVESDEADSGHIINVIQVGFQLHDRLLRPAMVVVAK